MSLRTLRASAFAVALALSASLALWQQWAPLAQLSFAEPKVHVALIGIATLLTASLAILALRTFWYTGAIRSLALAGSLTAFTAIYLWHGIFTQTPPPFAFLIYGPASRVAFGAGLLFLAWQGFVAKEKRFTITAGLLGSAVALAGLAALLHGPIADWAAGATPDQMNTIRLWFEWMALLLAATALALMLMRQGLGQTGAEVAIRLAIFIVALQSAYFVLASVWSGTWWMAHALGAASTLTLSLTVVSQLQKSERDLEVARLQDANAMKTSFMNTAAHELGTPLTPIRIHLSLLMRDLEDFSEKQQKSIRAMDRNVDRLIALTGSILESARIQSSKLPVTLEMMDCAVAVREIIESYEAVCEHSGIALTLEAPNSAKVMADHGRLYQIMTNLLTNSIKFTPSGGTIHVTLQVGQNITLQVKDSGKGLSRDQQRQLFQPFYQVNPGDSTQPGSGLGLFLSKQLTERMGGTIKVESPGLGRGATFTVTCPPGTMPAPGDAEAW